MVVNTTAVMLELLFFAALTVALVFVFKRFWPKTAMGWTKLVARLTMLGAVLNATMTVVTALIPNGVMKIDLKTAPFWPDLPSSLHSYHNNDFRIASGGFDTATVYVHGSGLGERLWLVFGALATAATTIALCFAAERIAQSLVAGLEFRAVSGKLLRRIALFTVIGGEVGHWATSIGANLIAFKLQDASYGFRHLKYISNPWYLNSGNGNVFQVFGLPRIQAGFFLTIELWPLLVGLGLYLLARIFESGSKLAADTDGLV